MEDNRTAIAALNDTQAQAALLAQQLAAVCDELKEAAPATAYHLQLSQRAVTLQGQLSAVNDQLAELKETAKTEQQLQDEARAQAEAARVAMACKVAQDKQAVIDAVTALNEASDRLVAALALAADLIPAVQGDLLVHGGYRVSGPWDTIRPAFYGGTGQIGKLPYVQIEPTACLLTTRERLGKHRG